VPTAVAVELDRDGDVARGALAVAELGGELAR
jgi:hypothetical protein